MDRVARNLIRKLLERDRTRRLGCMVGGANDIKQHRWFEHVTWTDIIDRRVQVTHCIEQFSFKYIFYSVFLATHYT